MASTRSKLDEIVESFSTLEDPRSHINRRHPLPSVLVIAVLAVLAGAAGPTAIARLRDQATAETGVERPVIAIDGNSARRGQDAAGLSDRFRPCYTAAVAAGKMADRCRRGRLKSSSRPRSEGNAFFGIGSGEPRRRHGCRQSRKPRPGGQKPRTPCLVELDRPGSIPDIRTRLSE